MTRVNVNDKFRFIILYRDCFTYQICGKYDYLNTLWSKYTSHEVHHIKTNQNNNFDNLITLCPKCHFKVHNNDWKNKPRLVNSSKVFVSSEMIENALLFKWLIDFKVKWGISYLEPYVIDRREEKER